MVLTTYDGDEDIYRALQAGARAYLLKGMTSEELIATIRAVHAGKSHIPAAIAEKLAERMGTEELTPREFDVLEQIVHGKSNKEIADRVGDLRGHGEDPHQQPAGQAGRDRPDAGGHGRHPARHCYARIPEKAETMKKIILFAVVFLI